jgi:hypothetical protein
MEPIPPITTAETSETSAERTCSILLDHGKHVLVEHQVKDKRTLKFARVISYGSPDPDHAHDLARRSGMRVVDFYRRVFRSYRSGTLIVRTVLADGRLAALSLLLHTRRSDEGWHSGFLDLHVEDPSGVSCQILGAIVRCNECWHQGHTSAGIAHDVFVAHGDSECVPEDQPEILWHALAGILVCWAREIRPPAQPALPTQPAPPAQPTQPAQISRPIETPSPIRPDVTRSALAVTSIAELLEKYGPAGISRLIERTVALLPDDLEGSDDLAAALGIATADLEHALRDAQRGPT